MLVLLTYNTHTHTFIHPDDSHERKHWQYSFQASLEQAAEELDSVIMEQLLEQVPQALQQLWRFSKSICRWETELWCNDSIYIYICVIHLKICLHILINDDDLTVNWVWVCCKNIATYPGCCSMFNSKGFARCKHLAEKDWYLVPWNRQQYGVSTRVPLMIHNCDVLVLYETFMKIGDTVPFLLQKPR